MISKPLRIGLLSDTHGFLDPKVFHYFQDVDEIWHAGDIGNIAVLKELEHFKPLKAVFGNIDSPELQRKLPEDYWINANGLNVFMTHIGGYPPKYNKRILGILKKRMPALFITGHSHILKIMTDKSLNNMLFINPGAAGNHGFHKTKTLVKFEIQDQVVQNLKVIEIGKRGQI